MDSKTARRLVRQMFDQSASRYVAGIEPAFKPLAERLVAFANIRPYERVLDVGTGTGLAAFAAAPLAAYVVGLDYAGQLLQTARTKAPALNPPNISFVQGDMHTMAFAEESFDVVLAAFSFNSSDPALSFVEARRVLVPGGRLVFQEWGTHDALSEKVYDALDAYAIEDPPPPLAALREALAAPSAWDDLENTDDLRRAVESSGFQNVDLREETDSVPFESVQTFLEYKLAWTSRHEELEAMPEEVRNLFLGQLYEELEPHRAEGGSLTWEPEVVRVRATKPDR